MDKGRAGLLDTVAPIHTIINELPFGKVPRTVTFAPLLHFAAANAKIGNVGVVVVAMDMEQVLANVASIAAFCVTLVLYTQKLFIFDKAAKELGTLVPIVAAHLMAVVSGMHKF